MSSEFNQEELFIVDPTQFLDKRPREHDARRALGGIMRPEYFGIKPEEFAVIEKMHFDNVEIANLSSAIFDNTRRGRRVNGLAVNALEFQVMVRSVDAFSLAVSSQTEIAREQDPNHDRKLAAADRSVDHALAQKAERAEGWLKWLDTEKVWLEKLQRELKAPGFAHMSEQQIADLVLNLQIFTIGNLLNVVGHEQNWSSEDLQKSRLAMIYRLVERRKRKDQYWRELVDFSQNYNYARFRMFKHKQKMAMNGAQRAAKRAKDRGYG